MLLFILHCKHVYKSEVILCLFVIIDKSDIEHVILYLYYNVTMLNESQYV